MVGVNAAYSLNSYSVNMLLRSCNCPPPGVYRSEKIFLIALSGLRSGRWPRRLTARTRVGAGGEVGPMAERYRAVVGATVELDGVVIGF